MGVIFEVKALQQKMQVSLMVAVIVRSGVRFVVVVGGFLAILGPQRPLLQLGVF